MKFTSIGFTRIIKKVLWMKVTTGYTITLSLDGDYSHRLMRRKPGRTAKGNPHTWRTASPGVIRKSSSTFTKMCRWYARGDFEIKYSLRGLNDICGQAPTGQKTPQYFYSDIITLDFGK